MHNKKKTFKLPPLFKKEKEFLSIANNPQKLNELKNIVNQAVKINEKFKSFKTLFEWYAYCETLIPEFEKKSEFTKKLEELIYEYTNESKGSDPVNVG